MVDGPFQKRLMSVWLVLLLWPAGLGWAAGPTTSAADRQQARTLAAQGRTAFQQGLYREASTLYGRAYAKDPQPDYLFNIARLRDKLGEWEDALTAYQGWLEHQPSATELAELRNRLVRDAEAAKQDAQTRELAIERLRLARNLGLPPDPVITQRLAELLEARGRPRDLSQALGLYRLALTEGGLETTALQEAVARLDERLGRGSLELEGLQPGDELEVDGQLWTDGTGGELSITPGTHRVVLRRGGQEPIVRTVEVPPGGSGRVQFAPRPAPPPESPPTPRIDRRPPLLSWIGMGSGSAALLASGLLYGLAWQAHEGAYCLGDPNCPAGGVDLAARDESDRRLLASRIGLGVGGALLAAGLVLWWLDDGRPVPPGPSTAEISWPGPSRALLGREGD